MMGLDSAGGYPLPTLWLYIYYTWWTKDAGAPRQCTYDQIALRQFLLLGVPEIIGVERSGTWLGDFREQRL